MDSFTVTHLAPIPFWVSHGQLAESSQASLHSSLYSIKILKRHPFADGTPRIRLIAARATGLVQIYTLARGDNGIWSIPSAPSEVEGVPAPLNSGTFVLDAHTGAPCKADKAHLTVALEVKAAPNSPEEGVRCLLLIVGAKGARCLADLSNERVARVEWGNKVGNVVRAQVVERNGSGIPSFDSELCILTTVRFRILRASCVY
jgi:hypothetical protein